MKIDSSFVGMESAGRYQFRKKKELISGDTGSESKKEEVKDFRTAWRERYQIGSGRRRFREDPNDTVMQLRQYTARYIFDLLFPGRGKQLQEVQTPQQTPQPIPLQPNFSVQQFTELQASWDVSFASTGVVKTADGREINFNISVNMSGRFQQTFSEELTNFGYQLCDPLVLNLDTDMASFSDQSFFFDIDADGIQDQISSLGAGSGYLALDQNGDGVINDGSELFGTKSGNGFADLAQYDFDQNGWIDENDEIWSKLQIWCKDSEGHDVLYRLADKGVGAIYLGNANTNLSLMGGAMKFAGALRRTGIFLYEDGNVGTVQHVDVAKYNQTV